MGLVLTNDGWRIPQELWARMEPLLPPHPAHPLGCHNPRVPDRDAMNAILSSCARARPVCAGSRIPRSLVASRRFGVSFCGFASGLLFVPFPLIS